MKKCAKEDKKDQRKAGFKQKIFISLGAFDIQQ
jgi:hypothetical protein